MVRLQQMLSEQLESLERSRSGVDLGAMFLFQRRRKKNEKKRKEKKKKKSREYIQLEQIDAMLMNSFRRSPHAR